MQISIQMQLQMKFKTKLTLMLNYIHHFYGSGLRILKARNNKVFRSKEVCIDRMLENVKVTTWDWLKSKYSNSKHNIAMWWQYPMAE